MNATSRRYDDVPYPDFIHPRTDPAHLAAVARLHGLETALPGRGTRVLEIGCGQAGNLLSLASMYPDAEFVGTDLSAKQIASGETLRAAAGIKNLRLTVADVTRWRDQGRDVFAGKFDFILVHGVYSWVPDEARRAILQICQEKLTDIGLALVSYNTYPGWHLKMMVRDLMHRVKPHSEVDEHDPVAGITARIDAIEQISKLAPAKSAYGTTLREAVGLLRRSEPAYLYHEQFEQINRPRWFQTFAAELGSYSLQHVTDANLVSSEIHALPESNRAALDLLPHVEAEQQLDLFINRTFRESIVVRDHRTFDRQHKPDVWQTLHFASALPTNDASLITRAELSPEQPLEIKTPSGLTIAIAATT
ncbi:MAG: methyltransferase regulatory domain-containing protein, partial [Planctomycetota bacterium]